MDDKKGVSLRKKRTVRPKISAPQLVSPPPTVGTIDIGGGGRRQRGGGGADGLPTGPKPRERPQNGDRTADYVKRRYSTRYAQLPPDFSAIPDVPNMPSMPRRFAVQPPQNESGRVKLDPKVLRDPKFRAEEYIQAVLSEASEEDINTFTQELRQMKSRADADLLHNIFQNRTQFIKISKETEKLRSEIRTLRNLMSELTGALDQASIASGANIDSLSARKQANRSSVANLEALWNTHLQTLWKRVEGSQRYLPAIPGRHIVYESSRWVELNAATWRPRRRVHLILLNDHLLIATEKKRADAAQAAIAAGANPRDRQPPQQLVATKCWPLQDVQMADLSVRSLPGSADKASAANAVNVRVGPDSFTFATGSQEADEKIALLATFRKTGEELRKTLEAESAEREKTRENLRGGEGFVGGGALAGLRTGLFEALMPEGIGGGKTDFIIDVDGKPKDLRWLGGQVDDLDADIALQRFEESVARIEILRRAVKQGIKGNVAAQDILTQKLNERAVKLADVVCRYLGDEHAWFSATQKHVGWLMRLGFEDRARETYLQARTDIIQKRIRQVIFDGDLPLYIYQTSLIYFKIIQNSAVTYENSFPKTSMSAFVRWAKEQVDAFNALLLRQLGGIDEGSDTYRACLDRAFDHAAILLDVGLDFRHFIGKAARAGPPS